MKVIDTPEMKGCVSMANFRENKKNGKVISFRFTVCLERDVRGKQIRKYTTWTAPADLTPAKARKAAERAADSPDALQNGGTELPHSFPRKDHGRALRIRRRRKAQREGIECACAGLLTFRGILQTLAIDRISVFATASLRNISNTEQALSVIHAGHRLLR